MLAFTVDTVLNWEDFLVIFVLVVLGRLVARKI